MSYELIHFPSDVALAQAAATQWLGQLALRNPAHSYTVALSGGRIARLFFEEIARKAMDEEISFLNVHFFWADERCVPPTDSESNYGIARQLLLEPLRIPDSQIHRLQGEVEEGKALRQAVDEISSLAPMNAAGQPVLDLIFLGLGEEGHTASLFPGEPEEISSGHAIYRAVTTPKPPPRRLTMGYATLTAAKEVWMLASGKGKEPALRESLSATGKNPFSRVVLRRQQTRIFTDLVI